MDGVTEYEYEYIEDVKRLRKGKYQVYFKWKGYSSNENTWEPLENIASDESKIDLLESLKQRLKVAPKKGADRIPIIDEMLKEISQRVASTHSTPDRDSEPPLIPQPVQQPPNKEPNQPKKKRGRKPSKAPSTNQSSENNIPLSKSDALRQTQQEIAQPNATNFTEANINTDQSKTPERNKSADRSMIKQPTLESFFRQPKEGVSDNSQQSQSYKQFREPSPTQTAPSNPQNAPVGPQPPQPKQPQSLDQPPSQNQAQAAPQIMNTTIIFSPKGLESSKSKSQSNTPKVQTPRSQTPDRQTKSPTKPKSGRSKNNSKLPVLDFLDQMKSKSETKPDVSQSKETHNAQNERSKSPTQPSARSPSPHIPTFTRIQPEPLDKKSRPPSPGIKDSKRDTSPGKVINPGSDFRLPPPGQKPASPNNIKPPAKQSPNSRSHLQNNQNQATTPNQSKDKHPNQQNQNKYASSRPNQNKNSPPNPVPPPPSKPQPQPQNHQKQQNKGWQRRSPEQQHQPTPPPPPQTSRPQAPTLGPSARPTSSVLAMYNLPSSSIHCTYLNNVRHSLPDPPPRPQDCHYTVHSPTSIHVHLPSGSVVDLFDEGLADPLWLHSFLLHIDNDLNRMISSFINTSKELFRLTN